MAVGIDTMACILWLYVVLTVLLPCVGRGDMLLVSVKVENRLFDLWIRKIVTAWRGGGIM
jgi:hypothetical protein